MICRIYANDATRTVAGNPYHGESNGKRTKPDGTSTLTRYDGWFLLPIAALYLLFRSGLSAAFVFCLVAGLGPLYWLVLHF